MQGESQRTHDLLTDATFRLARLEREVAGRRRAPVLRTAAAAAAAARRAVRVRPTGPGGACPFDSGKNYIVLPVVNGGP